MMEKLSIEQRIKKLEDIENIRQLTFQYAHYTNQGWSNEHVESDKIHNIFTEDAIWESVDMKLHVKGVDEIKASLEKETQGMHFAMHAYLNPTIEVNGDKAKGKWLFWIVSKPIALQTNEVYMSQDIEYTNTPNGWRINALRIHFGDIVKNRIQE